MAGCEIYTRIVLLLVLLGNNTTATNLQRFTSSYGSKRFSACDLGVPIEGFFHPGLPF